MKRLSNFSFTYFLSAQRLTTSFKRLNSGPLGPNAVTLCKSSMKAKASLERLKIDCNFTNFTPFWPTTGHVAPKTGAVEGKEISCSYSAQWFQATKTRRK